MKVKDLILGWPVCVEFDLLFWIFEGSDDFMVLDICRFAFTLSGFNVVLGVLVARIVFFLYELMVNFDFSWRK